ncbi:MAG TPA: GNAT family N-acetyltransferase [Gammaproteobacteria bacterium]|nr:GNAT family N-acetyltransferase [Gammaproteobacteria bacterium]
MNKASVSQITTHLKLCDSTFVPPLSERITIDEYAHKIVNHAVRFEAWSDNELIGLLAAYCNDTVNRMAFITNVSVVPSWHGKGIASQLMVNLIEYVHTLGFDRIALDVDEKNRAAIKLYEKHGFIVMEKEKTDEHETRLQRRNQRYVRSSIRL